MNIRIEIPVTALEPLLTALNTVSPTKVSRLEMKAIGVLKSTLYFEIEKIIESKDESEDRQIEFKRLFHQERLKRKGMFIKSE